jgi:hypothetical protein
VGWAKGIELAKLARRDRQHFDCATWLHKARELSKEDFQQAVERELTGKLTEPWEIVYFKLYQSQMPVIERAIETAALMLGSDLKVSEITVRGVSLLNFDAFASAARWEEMSIFAGIDHRGSAARQEEGAA